MQKEIMLDEFLLNKVLFLKKLRFFSIINNLAGSIILVTLLAIIITSSYGSFYGLILEIFFGVVIVGLAILTHIWGIYRLKQYTLRQNIILLSIDLLKQKNNQLIVTEKDEIKIKELIELINSSILYFEPDTESQSIKAKIDKLYEKLDKIVAAFKWCFEASSNEQTRRQLLQNILTFFDGLYLIKEPDRKTIDSSDQIDKYYDLFMGIQDQIQNSRNFEKEDANFIKSFFKLTKHVVTLIQWFNIKIIRIVFGFIFIVLVLIANFSPIFLIPNPGPWFSGLVFVAGLSLLFPELKGLENWLKNTG